MFDRIFITIGGCILSLIDIIKNISLKKEEEQQENAPILSSLNIKIDDQPQKYIDTPLDRIREILLELMLNKNVAMALLILATLMILFTSIELTAMFLVIIGMIYVFIFSYPKIKAEQSYSDLNKELPYALRHMGIDLKSGKGLHDVMITIKNADYGSLSKEFNRVLEEVKFGRSTEDALLDMTHRVKSQGLSRAVQQIIGTLHAGGNLAYSLEIIAKDISFDMQIKLKEYSQKLNSFILIYTFIAILAPVISLIMLMAGSTVMGDIISSQLILIIYGLFFPSVVTFMGVFIKKLEPKI